MNDFAGKAKDFLNKYKRYLGAAVLFIAFVLVLVNCTGPKNNTKDTQAGTEAVNTQQTEYALKGNLEKNASQELVDLFTNYYNAYASGDAGLWGSSAVGVLAALIVVSSSSRQTGQTRVS